MSVIIHTALCFEQKSNSTEGRTSGIMEGQHEIILKLYNFQMTNIEASLHYCSPFHNKSNEIIFVSH